MADAGLVDLYHFDESGFTTVPSVPYAWQPVGTSLELPSFKSKRLNVLGFLSKDGRGFFRHTEGPVDAGQVAAAFDAFAARRAAEYAVHGRPCVVNLDNAPCHTGQAFRDRTDARAACGVVVHYLPPYSPELNAIETLWRKIKYEWLPLDCYASYQTMKSAVLDILDGVGSKYQICFV
jgi:DDE superfamily endonuclease